MMINKTQLLCILGIVSVFVALYFLTAEDSPSSDTHDLDPSLAVTTTQSEFQVFGGLLEVRTDGANWKPATKYTKIQSGVSVRSRSRKTEFVLPDGSAVRLGNRSQIRVIDYNSTNGDFVANLESGSADFSVLPNIGRREFLVSIDDVKAKALGTIFSVHREEDGVRVATVEGSVSVAGASTKESKGVREELLVPAGIEARVASSGVTKGHLSIVERLEVLRFGLNRRVAKAPASDEEANHTKRLKAQFKELVEAGLSSERSRVQDAIVPGSEASRDFQRMWRLYESFLAAGAPRPWLLVRDLKVVSVNGATRLTGIIQLRNTPSAGKGSQSSILPQLQFSSLWLHENDAWRVFSVSWQE